MNYANIAHETTSNLTVPFSSDPFSSPIFLPFSLYITGTLTITKSFSNQAMLFAHTNHGM